MSTAPSWRQNVRLWLSILRVLSILCVLVGITWLLMLPLNEYSRRTYISENALLPGQVHTYFGGSEQNIYRAYKYEVERLSNETQEIAAERIASIFRDSGFNVGKQKYNYTTAGEVYQGENVYAILHAPRGDGTEAIVLCAPFRNVDHVLNDGGVAVTMTLARYFKRWSIWSKDIVLLISGDARAGPQAWVDAYHDAHSLPDVQSLPIKSGAIQGVVVVDYPQTHPRFDALHIVYDGINGQLPNLDLINTAYHIAQGQMGIKTTFQEMWNHDDSYKDRLRTILRGMVNQGLGHSTGPHSSFIPYHIDAITLQAYGDGWHDEMALGRTIESLFRSLNNLLEHFHQSFFFYLLMHPERFVSIGTYLPSAMLIAVGFTLAAMRLWIESGRDDDADTEKLLPEAAQTDDASRRHIANDEQQRDKIEAFLDTRKASLSNRTPEQDRTETDPTDTLDNDVTEKLALQSDADVPSDVVTEEQVPLLSNYADELMTVITPSSLLKPKRERKLFLPQAIVLGVHFFGFVPLSLFNNINHQSMSQAFYGFLAFSTVLPFILSGLVVLFAARENISQIFLLARCFSLLALGMFLSALATLNFSLSFLVGIFSFPLLFAKPLPNNPILGVALTFILQATSPFVALEAVGKYWGLGIVDILKEAAFGWGVHGMWTPMVVWCVWYPAWLVGCMSASASLLLWVAWLREEEAQKLTQLNKISFEKEPIDVQS